MTKFLNTYHSTLFLMGPLNQLKRMFALTRLAATIIFLVCLLNSYIDYHDLI